MKQTWLGCVRCATTLIQVHPACACCLQGSKLQRDSRARSRSKVERGRVAGVTGEGGGGNPSWHVASRIRLLPLDHPTLAQVTPGRMIPPQAVGLSRPCCTSAYYGCMNSGKFVFLQCGLVVSYHVELDCQLHHSLRE